MATKVNRYNPDYAVPPGWILEEHLEVMDMSQAEFARRCGRSAKLISEIISGRAPLEPATALQFEKVLGVDASIWIGLESNYQLRRARKIEEKLAARKVNWMKNFPVDELTRRGCFQKSGSDAETLTNLLAFFGVGSVNAWKERYMSANVAYRNVQDYQSNKTALISWRRMGELEAVKQECADYNELNFKKAVREIRSLTRMKIKDSLQQATNLCNQAGVALSVVRPLSDIALSGAAWWMKPGKPVIQLSAWYKSDDDLWFSFFHEAAHILLHSKRKIFIDSGNDNGSNLEIEANDWAANILVSRKAWADFVAGTPKTRKSIKEFSDQQKLAPGVIVGMLQRERHLPSNSNLNDLKVKYEWR